MIDPGPGIRPVARPEDRLRPGKLTVMSARRSNPQHFAQSERSSAARSQHVDAPDHLTRMIGLFQWAVVAQIACLFGGSPYAGRQDYVNAGMVVAQPTGKAEAAQVSGQFYVRENNIDMPPGLQNGKHVARKAAFDHDIAAFAQIFGDYHSHQDLRLDDEDRKRSGLRTAHNGHNIGHDINKQFVPGRVPATSGVRTGRPGSFLPWNHRPSPSFAEEL
jgi:hypothetical protein